MLTKTGLSDTVEPSSSPENFDREGDFEISGPSCKTITSAPFQTVAATTRPTPNRQKATPTFRPTALPSATCSTSSTSKKKSKTTTPEPGSPGHSAFSACYRVNSFCSALPFANHGRASLRMYLGSVFFFLANCPTHSSASSLLPASFK